MFTKQDYKFMDLTKQLAITTTPVRNYRITSIIVQKSNIISVGKCKMRSHPFQAKFAKNPNAIFLHSETNAIYNALKKIDKDELRKCTLYIFRVKRPKSRSSEWVSGNSCPCEGCMRAILTFDIKRVVYSTDTTEFGII